MPRFHATSEGSVQFTLEEELQWDLMEAELKIKEKNFIIEEKRKQRDELLNASDWIVSKSFESNQNIPVAWKIYRQALRDIPQQAGFPDNVVWPEKP